MTADDLPVPRIVLDTNVCLDLFLFRDPSCARLLAALRAGTVQAVTRDDCREEWQRVLHYPQLPVGEAMRPGLRAAYDALLQPLPSARVGVHVVVRAQGDLEALRELPRAQHPRLVAGGEGAGDADVEAAGERLRQLRGETILVAPEIRIRQQRDQSLRVLGQLLPAHAGLALGIGEPAVREQPAEVPVAVRVLHVDDQGRRVGEGDLTGEQEPDPERLRALVRLHRPIEPVEIRQRDRREPLVRGRRHQLLGMRSPSEKGEVGTGGELGVHAGKILLARSVYQLNSLAPVRPEHARPAALRP